MPEPYVYRLPVRFADTDLQGHVYFANYLTFCDEALAAYMRHVGYPWQAMLEDGVDMVYRSSSCEYLGSAKFEDELAIETCIVRFGNSSVVAGFEVRGPGGEKPGGEKPGGEGSDGETLARCELTFVCVDATERRPTRAPDGLRKATGHA